MDGVASIIPEPFYSMVEDIWAQLAQDCGVQGIMATPVPHFSWHVAEGYDQEALRQILEEVCKDTAPFLVQTSGLGIFSRERPVVYLALVKTQEMLEFHQHLADRLEPVAQGINYYYAPTNFMPHITLVFEDICLENIECVLGQLIFRPFQWTFLVDNLALIGKPEGQTGSVYFRYPLTGDV